MKILHICTKWHRRNKKNSLLTKAVENRIHVIDGLHNIAAALCTLTQIKVIQRLECQVSLTSDDDFARDKNQQNSSRSNHSVNQGGKKVWIISAELRMN